MKTQILVQHPEKSVLLVKRFGMSVFMSLTIALLVCACSAAQTQPPLFKGRFTSVPLHGNTPAQALRESGVGQTIPMWTYQVTSPKDGNTYEGEIMGFDWVGPDRITKAYIIYTYLVPLTINLLNANGSVAFTFDPTTTPPACAGGVSPFSAVQTSPLFDNSQVDYKWGSPSKDLGRTQYVDALLRAEFWAIGHVTPFPMPDVNYEFWHNQFYLIPTEAVTVDVPSGNWGVITGLPCVGTSGAIDYNWFKGYVETTLIPSLASQGVGPSVFPVLLTYNVITSPDHGATKYLGYHGAYGSPMQIYAEAMFDMTGIYSGSQDITALSHEMAEAMNDPTGSNPTPPWGNIGQVPGCQQTLEVGDPLSGMTYPSITLNGYTYHLQEMALFGWFFDVNWGIPGWYASNGSFTGTSKACPPGGTN